MTAATLNLTVEQGATFRTSFTWTLNGSPVNITNYTARMQIRQEAGSDSVLATLTTENGYITFVAGIGQIDIHIPASITKTFMVPNAVYDLFLTAPGPGDTTKLLEGAVTIDLAVTRN